MKCEILVSLIQVYVEMGLKFTKNISNQKIYVSNMYIVDNIY